jgi:hypothetical protein
MDKINVPYKVTTQIVTFEGDWTAEEIDAGLAGEATRIDTDDTWYEPGENGHVVVTDPARIAELEKGLRS